MNKAILHYIRKKELDEKMKLGLFTLSNSEIEEREVLPNTIRILCSHMDEDGNATILETNGQFQCEICKQCSKNPALLYSEKKEKIINIIKSRVGENPSDLGMMAEELLLFQKASDLEKSTCNHLNEKGEANLRYVGEIFSSCNTCYTQKY